MRVSGTVESVFPDGPPEGVDEEIAARHVAEPQALGLALIRRMRANRFAHEH